MNKPEKPCVLALDQGSQSTRAYLFDMQGTLIYHKSLPVSSNRIDAQRVELDGTAILHTFDEVLTDAFAFMSANQLTIDAVGMACQRSSVLAWDIDSGQALSPILSWQDTRTEVFVRSLSARHEWIKQRTGLQCSPHYGASKIAWLQRHVRINHQAVCLSPVASFYIHHLLGPGSRPMIDHANALRTQLVNLEHCQWDLDLLDTFGVNPKRLPDIVPIRFEYGPLRGRSLALTAVNGDQTAALFANGRPEIDTALVNLGTGGFVLMPSSSRQQIDGLLCSVCDSDHDSSLFVNEGTINGAGSAIAWAKKHLSVQDWDSTDLQTVDPGHEHLLFINTVSGLGSPWWKSGMEPFWCDDSGQRVNKPKTDTAMLAVLESIVFLVQCNLQRMLDAGCSIQKLHLSGGLCQIDWVCQSLANLSGLPVIRLAETEATARGIAFQAAGGPPEWRRGFGQRFEARGVQIIKKRYKNFIRLLNSYINY